MSLRNNTIHYFKGALNKLSVNLEHHFGTDLSFFQMDGSGFGRGVAPSC